MEQKTIGWNFLTKYPKEFFGYIVKSVTFTGVKVDDIFYNALSGSTDETTVCYAERTEKVDVPVSYDQNGVPVPVSESQEVKTRLSLRS